MGDLNNELVPQEGKEMQLQDNVISNIIEMDDMHPRKSLTKVEDSEHVSNRDRQSSMVQNDETNYQKRNSRIENTSEVENTQVQTLIVEPNDYVDD